MPQSSLTVKVLFGMALRQTTVFVESRVEAQGPLDGRAGAGQQEGRCHLHIAARRQALRRDRRPADADTHTKTRSGKRLRYYVSHRLIRRSGERGVDGWRLPAAALERKIAEIVREHLGKPVLAAALCVEGPASATAALRDRLSHVLESDAGNDDQATLALIERVDLAPGQVSIALNWDRLSHLTGMAADDVPLDALKISAPFQLRKRGVETRLVLGAEPSAEVDRMLLSNVATGYVWFERIKAGETYESIAVSDGVSKRRVMQLVELAFLSPEIVRDVLDGRQPAGLTTDLLLKRGFPVEWAEQRRLFDSL